MGRVIVAIDGPAGAGKSSVARALAARLGFRYLDTGAMYRAITWWMLRNGVPVDDSSAVAARCGEPAIVSGTDPADPTITVDGDDVAAAIRTPEVTGAVSAVSAVPQVRARLLDLQRSVIIDVSATESSLLARDRIDSTRTASPLVMAEGAVHLDTTPYTLDEVVDVIARLVEERS